MEKRLLIIITATVAALSAVRAKEDPEDDSYFVTQSDNNEVFDFLSKMLRQNVPLQIVSLPKISKWPYNHNEFSDERLDNKNVEKKRRNPSALRQGILGEDMYAKHKFFKVKDVKRRKLMKLKHQVLNMKLLEASTKNLLSYGNIVPPYRK